MLAVSLDAVDRGKLDDHIVAVSETSRGAFESLESHLEERLAARRAFQRI